VSAVVHLATNRIRVETIFQAVGYCFGGLISRLAEVNGVSQGVTQIRLDWGQSDVSVSEGCSEGHHSPKMKVFDGLPRIVSWQPRFASQMMADDVQGPSLGREWIGERSCCVKAPADEADPASSGTADGTVV
jgi:hypothetical protein